MKTQMKKKVIVKTIKKKRIQPLIIDENIEKFFPPVSRMGIGTPSQWKQVNPVLPQKTTKVPF